jgi:hypothetical protein
MDIISSRCYGKDDVAGTENLHANIAGFLVFPIFTKLWLFQHFQNNSPVPSTENTHFWWLASKTLLTRIKRSSDTHFFNISYKSFFCNCCTGLIFQMTVTQTWWKTVVVTMVRSTLQGTPVTSLHAGWRWTEYCHFLSADSSSDPAKENIK